MRHRAFEVYPFTHGVFGKVKGTVRMGEILVGNGS